MPGSRRTGIIIGAAAVALVGALAAALLVRQGGHHPPAPAGDAAPRRQDIAVPEGIDLAATADPEQRRLIEALSTAAPGAAALAAITVDYPQDGSIVPPDLAAPTFLWHDDDARADAWMVEVSFADEPGRISVLVRGDPPPQGEIDSRTLYEHNEIYRGTEYQQSARSWRPDPALWAAIKDRSAERPARLVFLGYRGAEPAAVVSRGAVHLTTSRDPVGAPIFYRDVPLMPSQTEEGVIKPLAKGRLPLINWRLRDVSRDDSRLMLTGMPTCANCHSFSDDGSTMGMDIDGPQGDRGAYTVVPVAKRVSISYRDVITWNAFKGKPKDFMTIGFLSRISPDGRHVLSTVNEELYVQNFWNYKFNQVFYPTRGILAFWSRDGGAIEALPGADDPRYVHCDPVWSPDGKTVVFARAAARDAYIKGRPAAEYAGDPNETPIQYDLYRIPFNNGRGGRPEPIAGASANGMSNTFPKVSPDGRWVVFVKCRNGQLMRPDGRLWIVPLAGGEAREMRCNLPVMNSWHSFSPNGRWMVFSSKGVRPYTQMFLTHIDADGNDSPPILIENATADNRAVNLPEFVNVRYENFQAIEVPAVDHTRHFNRGEELANQGKHEEAIAEYEQALATEPNDWKTSEWKIRDRLSRSLMALGRTPQALAQIRASLEILPGNPEMQTNLANLLFSMGRPDEALQHIGTAIRLTPANPKLWYNRATMRLQRGDGAAAISDYNEAIRLDATYADAYFGRGTALSGNGDRAAALRDFRKALEVAPPDWPYRSRVETILRQSGGAAGAGARRSSTETEAGRREPPRG